LAPDREWTLDKLRLERIGVDPRQQGTSLDKVAFPLPHLRHAPCDLGAHINEVRLDPADARREGRRPVRLVRLPDA
jgi:hypothetical protein